MGAPTLPTPKPMLTSTLAHHKAVTASIPWPRCPLRLVIPLAKCPVNTKTAQAGWAPLSGAGSVPHSLPAAAHAPVFHSHFPTSGPAARLVQRCTHRHATKPPRPTGMMGASLPPATITSASPFRMWLAAARARCKPRGTTGIECATSTAGWRCQSTATDHLTGHTHH